MIYKDKYNKISINKTLHIAFFNYIKYKKRTKQKDKR